MYEIIPLIPLLSKNTSLVSFQIIENVVRLFLSYCQKSTHQIVTKEMASDKSFDLLWNKSASVNLGPLRFLLYLETTLSLPLKMLWTIKCQGLKSIRVVEPRSFEIPPIIFNDISRSWPSQLLPIVKFQGSSWKVTLKKIQLFFIFLPFVRSKGYHL